MQNEQPGTAKICVIFVTRPFIAQTTAINSISLCPTRIAMPAVHIHLTFFSELSWDRKALEYGNLRHCTEVQDGDFFTNCTAISIVKKQIIRQIVGDVVQGTPQSANEANPRHPEATLPLQPPPTHQNLNSGASYA